MFTLNQLAVFKRVVETGSFNKAASEEYITTNAVMKQINNLESEIGVQLLTRSHKGVELTEAGIVFYEDAIKILSICENASLRAQSAARSTALTVRLGTSIANRHEDIEGIITKVLEQHPELQIEMIPFENTPDATAEIYANLGGKVDLVVSSFDSLMQAYWNFEALELSQVPLCIILPKTHKLAEHNIITFEEIKNETLIIVRRGYSQCLDEVRDYIDDYFPSIDIIDVPAFGMELYNKVVNNNYLMLGIGESIKGHPFTKRIPLDWNKKSPLGLLYAANPSKAVKKFLSAVEEIKTEL